MSSYFRWIKNGKKDCDYFAPKPRSRSLDSKSLEASGIRLILQSVYKYIYIYMFTSKFNKSLSLFHFKVKKKDKIILIPSLYKRLIILYL